jgi:hypothetical protein
MLMAQRSVRIKEFELITDAREVRVDQLGFDVMTHINCKEAEGVGCGINGEVVGSTESNI